MLSFVLEACGPKLISICFIPSFFVCVCVLFYDHTDRCCDRCRINLMLYWERNGEASDKAKKQLHCRSPYLPLWWCYSSFVRRKMEKKLGKGKGRTFQTTCIGFNGLKVFVCLEVSNVDFFFFFSLFLHFLGTQTKQVFILVIWNHVFFSHWFCTYQKDITNLVVSLIYF